MRFAEFLMIEAAYEGNIGMMEMFKFYQIATPEQKSEMKKYLSAGDQASAWEFLQTVTGTRLKS